MKLSADFSGGKEIAAKLADLSLRSNKRVTRDALTAAAETIRTPAARMAPRRPPAPDFADHIVIGTARARPGETAAIKVGPSTDFHYAFFQETGTVHHAARPFLRPAFEQNWRNALDVVRDAFWTVLASMGVSRSVSAPVTPEAPDGGDIL